MLASRVGFLGALVATVVLTLELGGAVAWQHRMTAIDLRVTDELVHMRLERELQDLDRQLAAAKARHFDDMLIVPNRAGY